MAEVGGIEARIGGLVEEGEKVVERADGPQGWPAGVDVAGPGLVAGDGEPRSSLRWDRHSSTGDEVWSPRLELAWRAGAATTVRASWGLFHQSQRPFELQTAYDRENVGGFDYEIDEDEGALLSEPEEWPGLVPSAGVRIEL